MSRKNQTNKIASNSVNTEPALLEIHHQKNLETVFVVIFEFLIVRSVEFQRLSQQETMSHCLGFLKCLDKLLAKKPVTVIYHLLASFNGLGSLS